MVLAEQHLADFARHRGTGQARFLGREAVKGGDIGKLGHQHEMIAGALGAAQRLFEQLVHQVGQARPARADALS